MQYGVCRNALSSHVQGFLCRRIYEGDGRDPYYSSEDVESEDYEKKEDENDDKGSEDGEESGNDKDGDNESSDEDGEGKGSDEEWVTVDEGGRGGSPVRL